MGGKALRYNEYITSDVWKCPDSPTGGHHWIEVQGVGKQFHTGLFYCKYCHDTKEMPTGWDQVRPKGDG